MINIEKMIKIVCGMIQKETGVDIQRASTITEPEIKNEILRRSWAGENFMSVVEDVKRKYDVSFINWR